MYEHKRADVSSVGPIGRTEVLKLFFDICKYFLHIARKWMIIAEIKYIAGEIEARRSKKQLCRQWRLIFGSRWLPNLFFFLVYYLPMAFLFAFYAADTVNF